MSVDERAMALALYRLSRNTALVKQLAESGRPMSNTEIAAEVNRQFRANRHPQGKVGRVAVWKLCKKKSFRQVGYSL